MSSGRIPKKAEAPYWLEPGTKQEMAGIATFVMRGKEETLRFHDEIRSPEDIGLPAKGRPAKEAVATFERLIRKSSVEKLPSERLKDSEAQRLLDLIRRKEKRDEDVVKPRGGAKAQKDNVVDLLDVLRQAIASRRSGIAFEG